MCVCLWYIVYTTYAIYISCSKNVRYFCAIHREDGFYDSHERMPWTLELIGLDFIFFSLPLARWMCCNFNMTFTLFVAIIRFCVFTSSTRVIIILKKIFGKSNHLEVVGNSIVICLSDDCVAPSRARLRAHLPHNVIKANIIKHLYTFQFERNNHLVFMFIFIGIYCMYVSIGSFVRYWDRCQRFFVVFFYSLHISTARSI